MDSKDIEYYRMCKVLYKDKYNHTQIELGRFICKKIKYYEFFIHMPKYIPNVKTTLKIKPEDIIEIIYIEPKR